MIANSAPTLPLPIVKKSGIVPYEEAISAMRAFTDARTTDTRDEIWVLQHPAVYTLGQASDEAHLLNPGAIPIVQSDRGGQVTYHGPGQLIVYTLLDLRRHKLGVRSLVELLENAVIMLLRQHGIDAVSRRDAPGVYVEAKKIAALGLRIRRGCSFHGLSLNTDMDLEPFTRINPCGFAGLEVTQISDYTAVESIDDIGDQLVDIMNSALSNRE